ncbi:MAG TPA: hypothetical protein VGG42_18880 [Acidobacteriaceae bacterium]|jgi:hypothetical protein
MTMRIFVRGLVLLLCAIGVGAALAQKPAAPPAAPIHAPERPGPQLTETESLKLENLQLKATVLQQQQQQLQQEFAVLMQSLSAEHVGYAFDPNSRTFRPLPKPETSKNTPEAKK